MPTPVVDFGSNKQEQIVNAAEVIGGRKTRQRVFKAIYSGKQRVKTVKKLMKMTGLDRIDVLHAGQAFDSNHMVNQTKLDGMTAYEKLPHFQPYRDSILKAAKDKDRRHSIPTKRNPARSGSDGRSVLTVKVRLPRNRDKAVHVTIDDMASFKKASKISSGLPYVKISETTFKNGVAKILGERGSFKDWGGELRDLSSTRLWIDGKRRAAAFAFKGPGTSGRLTPRKLGTNGDQIQRLVRCPAEVFLIQYWAEIDDSVFEQLEKLVRLKAYLESRKLWYGVIDGQDSARLIKAYPEAFSHHRKR